MINFTFCKKLAWFWCLLFCDPKKWKLLVYFFFSSTNLCLIFSLITDLKMQGYFVMNSIKRPLFNYCMLPYLVQEYDLILQLHIVTSSLCIL